MERCLRSRRRGVLAPTVGPCLDGWPSLSRTLQRLGLLAVVRLCPSTFASIIRVLDSL